MTLSKTEIEALTPTGIRKLLVAHGILSRSGSWHDYGAAKKAIFQDTAIDPKIYDKHISVITKYLNL